MKGVVRYIVLLHVDCQAFVYGRVQVGLIILHMLGIIEIEPNESLCLIRNINRQLLFLF
jgi:hypothetical protein